jgi:N-sulfoglucosamine sulfohydrolase
MRSTSFLLLLSSILIPSLKAGDRPNILWITAEDMSPALGCYGDDYATTPNIDRLAETSVKYSHAFATAPVCSPVRSCLITGCYAQSMGTHNMRSAMPLPDGVRGFPSYLRDAGYYTSNNDKTDYNTSDAARLIKESWNESSETAHWRQRTDKSQPFFSVFNLMTSHQSRTMVWPYDKFRIDVQSRLSAAEIHDPAKAVLPPYYPDTSIIRREWARFYDCVTAMDKEVGNILTKLHDDGLDDNTIVFFFSDHGSGMPRHKRALLDSGMHVPLLIRFPDKWKHLAPTKPGQTTDRLVSFVDFPATVLNLIGTPIPDTMQGLPFLGTNADRGREFAFGHRDRVDEAFDCSRSVRSRRFLYIRNYMPHISYNQPTAWPDQGEIRHEFYRLARRGSMTEAQWHFAGPTKPAEELFDCEADPLNTHNLAADPQRAEDLRHMRQTLEVHLTEIHDLGFIPEASLHSLLESEVEERTVLHKVTQVNQVIARNVGLTGDVANQDEIRSYWQAITLMNSGTIDPDKLRIALPLRMHGADDFVCATETANAILSVKPNDATAINVLLQAVESEDLNIVLHAVRAIELLGENAIEATPAIRKIAARCNSLLPTNTTATFVQTPEQDLAMFISFSATAFLRKHGNAEGE